MNELNNINAGVTKLLTVPELQQILDIGRDTAYNLVCRKDFPSVKIGREHRVLSDKLNDWLIKQQRNK